MSEKILIRLIYQALFVALFVSCEKSGTSVDDPELSTVPIEFSLADFSAGVKGNAVDKDIFLPAYMNGMQIEVLDKTGSVECVQTHISDRKLRYNTNGSTKDYLVVKLSK